MARASGGQSPGGTRRPVRSWSTRARRPWMSLATEGTPNASPVARVRPTEGTSEGWQNTSSTLQNRRPTTGMPANVTRSAIFRRSARRRRSTSSSPWPAITNSASRPASRPAARRSGTWRTRTGHERAGSADHRDLALRPGGGWFPRATRVPGSPARSARAGCGAGSAARRPAPRLVAIEPPAPPPAHPEPAVGRKKPSTVRT